MNIYQKLIEVRKVVPYLQKENNGQQYKYVSSSQTLSAVREKMDELGLILEPEITSHNLLESAIEYKDKDGNVTKRTTTYFTELEMTMTWVNADNPEEKIIKKWYGQGVDIAGEKGVGKALTYAEKYFLLKFFNIATDKDDPDTFQGNKPDDKKLEQPTQQSQNNRAQTNKPPQKISSKQLSMLYTIATGKPDIAKQIITKYGFASSKDVTTDKFEEVKTEIENAMKEAQSA